MKQRLSLKVFVLVAGFLAACDANGDTAGPTADTIDQPADTLDHAADTTAQLADTTAQLADTGQQDHDTSEVTSDTTAEPEDTTTQDDDTSAETQDTTSTASDEVVLGSRSYLTLPVNGTQVFPTYLAHLMGKDIGGQVFKFMQPIAVTNESQEDRTVTLRVSVPGYAHDGTATVNIDGGETVNVDVQPQLDLASLYAINAPTQVQVIVTVDESGIPIQSTTDTLQLAPRNSVFWAVDDNGQFVDLRPFVTTLVMPNDSDNAIQGLLTEAAQHHPLGAMLGYQYGGQIRTDSIGPYPTGPWLVAAPLYRAGQQLSISASLGDCPGCEYYPQIHLLTPTQCDAWLENGADDVLTNANITETGAELSAIAPETGYYCYVLSLPGGAGTTSITLTRPWGFDEGARAEISAIFDALHDRGLVYVNVPGTFFDGAQNVKLPFQSLSTGSSNCIDGSLVFASALEALGMQPVIVFVPGHAFVGVVSLPDEDFIEFIETTIVSSGDAAAAIETARERIRSEAQNAVTEPWVLPALVYVKRSRELGITPMPF